MDLLKYTAPEMILLAYDNDTGPITTSGGESVELTPDQTEETNHTQFSYYYV